MELVEAKKWWWEGVEVGTGTGWPRGTLAEVAGGGHLWWIRARAWQGRRAFWRPCVVDLGEMDAEKCREDRRLAAGTARTMVRFTLVLPLVS